MVVEGVLLATVPTLISFVQKSTFIQKQFLWAAGLLLFQWALGGLLKVYMFSVIK